MSGLNGDFLGFTFITNGKAHKSQDLGITRVSDGDRYNEPLIPEIEDKTIEIPGLDGTYFYGSDFKTRNFSIKIAFDSMTEENFREMRQVFGYKHMGLLIFDEAPYKQYKVKVASPPELEYVCFDERRKIASENAEEGIRTIRNLSETVTIPAFEDEVTLYEYSLHEQPIQKPVAIVNGEEIEYTYNINTNKCIFEKGEEETIVTLVYDTKEKIYPYELSNGLERIYKGEGTIEFIAYYPFATQTHKFLDNFSQSNKNEWAAASHLLTEEGAENLDKVIGLEGEKRINIYNAGDVSTGFMIWMSGIKTTSHEKTFSIEGKEDPYTFEIAGEITSVKAGEQLISNEHWSYSNNTLMVNKTSTIEWDGITEIAVNYNTSDIVFTNWENDLKLRYNDNQLIISKDIEQQSTEDMGILINTVNSLVEGIKSVTVKLDGSIEYNTSGTVYNRYVKGHFFKIEPGDGTIYIDSLPVDDEDIHIFYNYLYF